MKIDEAIRNAKKVMEEKQDECQECLAVHDTEGAFECEECALEHKQLAEWLEELKRLREQTAWIPVSEKLPDLVEGSVEDDADGINSVTVLITALNTDNGKTIVDYGYIVDGEWWSYTEDYMIPNGWEVVAWKPLPKPYKTERSEI